MDDSTAVPAEPVDGTGQVPTVMVAALETAAQVTPFTTSPPFRRLDDDDMARIVLLQTDATHFQLYEGFRYDGMAGQWTVTPTDLPDTDLASIPPFLGWFASRYGNHTLAALLHDHLVRNGARLEPVVPRSDADDVFRTALDELEVPYLRARIMWAAVTLATRWRNSGAARVAVGLWMAAAASGIVALVWGLTTMNPGVVAAAVLCPLPASLLWSRRQLRAGVFGGYTLWLVAVPALINIAAYTAYNVAERAFRQGRKLRPANRARKIPGPPPYTAR
ncbi:MAG: DUF1353 domain-containing protein [Acidimicrobiales bacterium]